MTEAFNQDCLEMMRGMEDNAFDLAIVDPPYGIDVAKSSQIGYKGFNVFTPKKWDAQTPDEQYFTELSRVSVNQIIWGGNYFNLPPSRCFLIWDKGEGFYGRSYAECELAWTSMDANVRKFKHDPLANGDYHGKIHPTQKPVALYKWLLTNYTKQGDRILDTHLGSGSSRIAAYDLGFDFTGYELDTDYFNAQEERFARHIAQPKLFTPQVEVKQEAMFA
jgi:site-specific DNA-methyltransferase (adenine-specific)